MFGLEPDSECFPMRRKFQVEHRAKYFLCLDFNRWIAQVALTVASMLLSTSLFAAKTVTYYYTDPQGSVLATTDAQGNLSSSRDYRPFGETATALSEPASIGYAGHVEDGEADLIYMQARYYDPSTGRFLSVDIILPEPAALDLINRYAYVANNPMSLSDPTGMFAEGMSAADINCEVYHCQRVGGSIAQGAQHQTSAGYPKNTPNNMQHYFTDTSASGRETAGKAVMDFFHINYDGLVVVYAERLDHSNALMGQDGQLTLGPSIFKQSFGLMGAMLSHEVEGHWLTQMFRSTSLKQDTQSFWMREVQAYDIELSTSNVSRFGLTPAEVSSEGRKRDAYFNGLNDANKSLVRHHIYKPLGD